MIDESLQWKLLLYIYRTAHGLALSSGADADRCVALKIGQTVQDHDISEQALEYLLMKLCELDSPNFEILEGKFFSG